MVGLYPNPGHKIAACNTPSPHYFAKTRLAHGSGHYDIETDIVLTATHVSGYHPSVVLIITINKIRMCDGFLNRESFARPHNVARL